VCNSAESRPPNEWEPKGCQFPGWVGAISPWGEVMAFLEDEGNDERMILAELDPRNSKTAATTLISWRRS
jgi:predicted amidohydrolase